VHGFVLAGGLSTRMGQDKARLELGGRPLIAIAVDRLRALGLEARICGTRTDLAEFAPVIADRFERCGPLGGIDAALEVSDTELNLFVPVDLPEIPLVFLRWMMERAERTGAVATIPMVVGRAQPLCAVYSRRVGRGLRRALSTGQYKVMRALEDAAALVGERVDLFSMETVAAALPSGTWPPEPRMHEWFRNANTPADFAWLQRRGAEASGAEGRHPIS